MRELATQTDTEALTILLCAASPLVLPQVSPPKLPSQPLLGTWSQSSVPWSVGPRTPLAYSQSVPTTEVALGPEDGGSLGLLRGSGPPAG